VLDHTGAEGTSTALAEMSDQTYYRVDLATQQLNVAISLFLKRKSFVAALTLAGAAEEILGKALSHRDQQNSLELKYEIMEPILTMRHQTKEDFIEDENRALIAVRHMASASDQSVTLDLEEAAYSMIVRACDNYDLLGLPRTANMRAFGNWFYEHVVGPP
jgi:hypothetical protein